MAIPSAALAMSTKPPAASDSMKRWKIDWSRRRGTARSFEVGDVSGCKMVEKLAEMRRQHDDAHGPVHSIEHYRERHARRHPGQNANARR